MKPPGARSSGGFLPPSLPHPLASAFPGALTVDEVLLACQPEFVRPGVLVTASVAAHSRAARVAGDPLPPFGRRRLLHVR